MPRAVMQERLITLAEVLDVSEVVVVVVDTTTTIMTLVNVDDARKQDMYNQQLYRKVL